MPSILVLAGLAYSFAPNVDVHYRLEVQMDGYLPVLGGKEGVAKLQVEFTVTGLPPIDGLPRTEHRPVQFKAFLNDAPMPFSLENVSAFFPKATVVFWPSGKVKSTTAPDKPLPTPLPGLDLRRFAEMTYLPCEFPQSGAERWTFSREMGGAPMQFEAKVLEKNGTRIAIELSPSQTTVGFEDDNHRSVQSEKGAEYRLSNKITGKGALIFNSELGQIESLDLEALTVTEVRGIINDYAATRRLKTTVSLRRLAEKALLAPH